MDIILIIVGLLLAAFTVTMIITFFVVGSIPDTLCTCVFAALGGECGVMGWIKTAKERNRKDDDEDVVKISKQVSEDKASEDKTLDILMQQQIISGVANVLNDAFNNSEV